MKEERKQRKEERKQVEKCETNKEAKLTKLLRKFLGLTAPTPVIVSTG